MKNFLQIILIIAALFNVVTSSCGQNSSPDAYYFYDNSRINLFRDSNSIVMYFKENFAYKNRDTTFTNLSIIEIDASDGSEDTLMARISCSKPIKNIPLFLDSMNIFVSDLNAYSYGYTRQGDSKLWPTLDVLFRLNPEIIIDSLQILFDQFNASFVSEEYGVYTYTIANINDVFNLANSIYENGYAQWAEPDFYTNFTRYNDPYYPYQWYLNNTGQIINGVTATNDIDIDAPEAWNISLGSTSIKVAVIDDGVEDHEDLKDANGNSRVLTGYTPPNCASGCDGRPRKHGWHGQCCAGVIAASHNDIGVKGIAPNINIIPIRIYKGSDAEGTFSNAHIAKAIGKAWDELGADILSCSWGKYEFINCIRDAFQNAMVNGRNGKGCVVVAGAGNEGNNIAFPANLPGVIAVGALHLDGSITNYSNWGPELSIVALGGYATSGIFTIDREGIYGKSTYNYWPNFYGTSASCPQVAGVAALLLSVDPTLTESEVYCRLTRSAIDMGDNGKDDYYGYGRLNAYYAIALNNMTIRDKNFGHVQTFTTSNTITIGPNVTFQNTSPGFGNITVTAGNRITALPGTKAESGSYFHAYISNNGPCRPGPKSMLNNSFNSPENNNSIVNSSSNSVSELLIFPNPSQGFITIKYQNQSLINAKLQIFNMVGKIVYEDQIKKQLSVHLDLSEFTEGLYIIKLSNSEGSTVGKFIKD